MPPTESAERALGAGEYAIDLKLAADWATVSVVRRSVEAALQQALGDEGATAKVAVVATELAENAVKYGVGGPDRTYRVRVWGDPACAHVRVDNEMPSADTPATLLATLATIESFGSPKAAYTARILEVAARRGSDGPSRLGLVRLAVEAGCALRAEIEGTALSLVADVPLATGPTSDR